MFLKNIFRHISALLISTLLLGIFSIPSFAESSGISLSGTCHVQNIGDTKGEWDEGSGTLTLGTRGRSLRLEAVSINLNNQTGIEGAIRYSVHIQNIGWQEPKNNGTEAGTRGRALRLEGIRIELTGELAKYYTVEYAVHIQDYGDAQGFVSDGALAGTTGESKRLEELKIRIIPRGSGNDTSVKYRVHRQDLGWETAWKADGDLSGTTGQAKRLEGIEIHLAGNQYEGGITYKTHIQNIGWESTWQSDGGMSGTQGQSLRLEAIEIMLTGEIAGHYDVYYRVHAQDHGWLGWAKNGEMSGTSGESKRLEAIQIVLVPKGELAPGDILGIKSTIDLPVPPKGLSPQWVRDLPEAKNKDVTELVIVSCSGMNSSDCTVSLHKRDNNGYWICLLETPGYVGRYGLIDPDTRVEGCKRTPTGTYRFTMAFGIASDPGSALPYTKVTSDLYWSGDGRPGWHYNEMVSIKDYPGLNTSNSEHLINYTKAYQYCLNIGFNEEGISPRGSAIFLHCFGNNRYTSGCVAVSKDSMIKILQTAGPHSLIVINTAEALGAT